MHKQVQASDLKYSKLQISEIDSQVRSILLTINDCIVDAHEQGKESIEVPLPIAFDIPHLNQFQAKVKIYSLVVEDLTSDKKKFSVKLDYSKKESSKLFITWMSEEDEMLREHEREIIEFYVLPFSERKNKDRPRSLPFDERIKQYTNPL